MKEENGYYCVDYVTIYKLNQEIVSEEKEDIIGIDVRDRIDENRRNGVKMLLERYWE
jgi:hypothetical protein